MTHLSRDDVTGGAARCAYRLHEGLQSIGVNSTMRVARRRGADPAVERWVRERSRLGVLPERLVGRRIRRDRRRYRDTEPPDTELFSDDRVPGGAAPLDGLSGFDVVNVHWINGFVDYTALMRAAGNGASHFVWTLHDMNAFTGGCHYSGACRGFEAACGSCPQLGSSRPSDLSRAIWSRKARAVKTTSRGDLHIVTPSRWLASEVRSSSLFGERFEVSVIPYGLDLDVMTPRPKAAARDALGLPRDARIVLFVAQSVDNPRKGFGLLSEAVAGLDIGSDLVFLSMGAGVPELPSNVSTRHVGYTTDDGLLSIVYSAADLFVTPTQQDNLPATILEAMACGTATTGFDVGGVPELIRPGVNGSLAEAGDVDSLGSCIRQLLQSPDTLIAMGGRAREIAVDEYPLALQAKRYLELYQRLLKERPRKETG